MQIPALVLTSIFASLAFQESASKPAAIDFSKVDRKIESEPKYVAAPKYALLLLGTEGKARIWIAMDKSKADLTYYDVFYVDRDADGKLGEEGERFAGSKTEHGQVRIDVGPIERPEAKLTLTDFHVYTILAEGGQPVMLLRFRCNGQVTLYGGYGLGGKVLEGAGSPEKAPIIHADPFGPLTFLNADDSEMRIGENDAVMLYVGNRGAGPATFLAVDEGFLDLDKDKIIATIIAKDRDGKEIRHRVQLKDHC